MLRLYKPTDDDTDWGDEFRASMDIIDLAVSVARLTNRDAQSAPVGSVVVTSLISESFHLASTAYSENVLGVTLDPIPAKWAGLVKITGFVAAVRMTGSVSIGDFLYASGTSGVAQASSARRAGAFARAMSTKDSNNCVKAVLMTGIGGSPLQVLRVRIPSSIAAGDFERSIMMAERDCEIASIYAIMDSNVTGDNTDFAELSIRNKAMAGEINDFVFSLGNDATAFVAIDFGTPDGTNKVLNADDVVTLRKTHTGTGLALPEFLLQLTYNWI